MAAGQFREDLLYRLRVIHLHVPPCVNGPKTFRRSRGISSRALGRRVTFTDEALRAFLSYRWPGNVRELFNVVEQLVWLSTDGVVEVEHLPVSMRSGPSPMTPIDDRRRQVADDLYDAVVTAGRVVLGTRLPDVPRARHHAA